MAERLLFLLAPTVAFLALACGDDGGGTEITVPYSVIEALDRYEFTSDIEITSADGDLNLHVDGAIQAPDRVRGDVGALGTLLGSLGLPSEMAFVAIADGVWMRPVDGDWQEGDAVLRTLAFFGTPLWYTRAFQFESVQLQTTGTEEIDGVEAHVIELDRAALLELIGLTEFTQEGDVQEINIDQLEESLPDISFKAWLAESDLRLIAFEVTLTGDEDDMFEFLAAAPYAIRLYMDITDPDADVQIEPPE